MIILFEIKINARFCCRINGSKIVIICHYCHEEWLLCYKAAGMNALCSFEKYL